MVTHTVKRTKKRLKCTEPHCTISKDSPCTHISTCSSECTEDRGADSTMARTYIAYVEVLFVLQAIHFILKAYELSDSQYKRKKSFGGREKDRR